ncbi:hypothetical protein FLX56_26055 [Synechococcus moorigangaii CMS01]|nr:hypothetical protein [Synechococcus moorigangaii CMS01]
MGNIVVIGPRKSGKTTFLTGLAYWPQRQKALDKGSIFHIDAVNEGAQRLIKQAKDTILPQSSVRGTEVLESSQIPDYHFRISLKRKFAKEEVFDLVVRDSAGELFEDLQKRELSADKKEIFEDFLRGDDIGCLILLSEWQKEDDEDYSLMFTHFLELLDINARTENFRIAIAMSKCERGELWSGRIEPEIDIFRLHFPRTLSALQRGNIPKKNVRFFATSTFGVLDRNDPRPNRIDEPGKKGRFSVLREPDRWQPYNMISPLYWLQTGKRMRSDV